MTWDGICEHGLLLDTYCEECDKPMKRDTELWLLVREIRAEYWRMAIMFEQWGKKLERAEGQLKTILDGPDAQAAPIGSQSDAASSSEGDALAWDEQTR